MSKSEKWFDKNLALFFSEISNSLSNTSKSFLKMQMSSHYVPAKTDAPLGAFSIIAFSPIIAPYFNLATTPPNFYYIYYSNFLSSGLI